jgi:alpha-beta hydrolase superfamily lysophospholipase
MNSTLIHSQDGTELQRFQWAADGEPKGNVLLVHGLGEHLQRYNHVAAALTAAGYEVSGVDFRGHGLSKGRRGHVARWENYVDDLRAAADAIAQPFFLVAHSMGTLVSLDYLRGPHSARAIALSGPLLGVAVEAPRWKTAAANLMSTLLPWISLSNELDADDICSDPDVVKRYLDDPLTFHTITPRWFTEMLQALDRVNQCASDYRLPLWLHHGKQDKIICHRSIETFVPLYGGPKEFHVWPEGKHEIFNENFQSEVLQDLVRWLNLHA